MDTLASLALATEPPTESLLNRKPIPPSVSILTEVSQKGVEISQII